MISSNKNIYIQETEVKPNKHSIIVLSLCAVIILFSWLLNEIGLFRVGDLEMRIGTIITFITIVVPIIIRFTIKDSLSKPFLKYVVLASSSLFTLSTNVLLGFHTTIMLLFPIFLTMLYRSKKMGQIAAFVSIFCSLFCPIIGYLLNTWDVPLFQELILISTNGTAEIVGAYSGHSWLNIGKILIYLSLPRALMAGSFTVLMFKVIEVSVDHVNNQIILNDISHKDNLTGLYNQNYFNKVLENPENIGVAGVIFFDVNGLKETNDKFGHEIGDLLIKRSALSILKVCDFESTHPFRLGGDEFIILVENATEVKINDILNAWNAYLYSINAENERTHNGINCSIAYGFAIGDYSKLDEIVSLADERMYVNKARMKSNNL